VLLTIKEGGSRIVLIVIVKYDNLKNNCFLLPIDLPVCSGLYGRIRPKGGLFLSACSVRKGRQKSFWNFKAIAN